MVGRCDIVEFKLVFLRSLSSFALYVHGSVGFRHSPVTTEGIQRLEASSRDRSGLQCEGVC